MGMLVRRVAIRRAGVRLGAVAVFAGLLAAPAGGQELSAPSQRVPVQAAQAVSSTPLGPSLRRAVEARAGAEGSDALDRFYRLRDFAPAWRDGDGWTEAGRAALATLSAAARHGLDPADYAVDPSRPAGASDAGIELEIATTGALLAYVADLRRGRDLGEAAALRVALAHPPEAPAALLARGLRAPRFDAWLEGIAPARFGYAALREHLARLRVLAGEGDYPRLPEGPLLRPGDSDARVPTLRRQLRLLGDLEAPAAAGDERRYDAVLEAALRGFQARHGLDVDGIVGPRTRALLNLTPAQRARRVALNLERLRWLQDAPERFLLVNLAGYDLTAYDNDVPVRRMPVVVGRPDWQTPVMTDAIVSLVLRPTWTVPKSIAQREFVPRLMEDPGWLAEKGYRLYYGWDPSAPPLDPATVDWARYRRGPFPFRIVQPAGDGNALGRVRFSLTNKQSIYLHDTPAKDLLARSERALSHGCVRVAEPEWLVGFALRGDRDWSEARIEQELGQGETRWLRLQRPLPVYLFYRTAWVDEAGRLNLRADVYGRDAKLAEALGDAAAPLS